MSADPPVPPPAAPRKLRFKPKPPPPNRGLKKPKNEANDEHEETTWSARARVIEEHSRRRSKVERKSGSSSTSKRTPAKPIVGENKKSNSSDLGDSAEKCMLPSSTTTKTDEGVESSSQTGRAYKEPWGSSTCPPICLPMPDSGNSEALYKEEFDEAEEEKEHNENINDALALGLLEENKEPQFLLFQFPTHLPIINQKSPVSASTKGKELINSSSRDTSASVRPLSTESASNRCSILEDLAAGYMGKMLVYRSGAVKLKLGDNTFNVFAGANPKIAQNAAVVNTESKDFYNIAKLDKKAAVALDVDSILNNSS